MDVRFGLLISVVLTIFAVAPVFSAQAGHYDVASDRFVEDDAPSVVLPTPQNASPAADASAIPASPLMPAPQYEMPEAPIAAATPPAPPSPAPAVATPAPDAPSLPVKQSPADDNVDNATQLSVGDKLRITVFEDQNISGEYQIADNGVVVMPFIGDVPASGMTQKQLEAKLTAQYSQGYLVNPHISVRVLSLRPFYILGEVNTPGVYDYTPSLTVFKAIAIAGGFTPRAKKDDYTIIRTSGENSTEIDADDLTPILPGDAIRVDERFF